MKKTVLISLAILLISTVCNAQLSAPVQSDTLYITSMQYNFKDISRENWPFNHIIQAATFFKVDGKEFPIKDVEDFHSSRLYYTLLDGNNEYRLIKKQNSDGTTIEFSNYILNCSTSQDTDNVNCSTSQDSNKVEREFKLVAHQPSFQGGGPNEFTKWVNEHLKYPEIAKENGVQGRVTVQYTIDKQGRVTDVSVLRGVEPSLDKEAVRVVYSSPKWTPGKDGKGNPVDVSYTFPVIFQLR